VTSIAGVRAAHVMWQTPQMIPQRVTRLGVEWNRLGLEGQDRQRQRRHRRRRRLRRRLMRSELLRTFG
jgi:hypothetical protein